MPSTRLKKITEESIGSVTWRKRCRLFAPSICAASYKWVGMPWRPARKMTIVPPTVHRLIRISEGLDQTWSEIQPIGGSPTRREQVVENAKLGVEEPEPE